MRLKLFSKKAEPLTLRIGVAALGLSLFTGIGSVKLEGAEKPNFVVIFADDLGYGDLGVFGHPTILTPNLDQLAAEGQKWTQFYSAANVCTPSRAALMTGRYPIRSGMCSNTRRVLFPDSAGGLPQSEITIAKGLKQLGYKTAAVGKWHLGHLPEFLPTSHGFDSYFGIPYSNDMDRNGATSPKGRAAFDNPSAEYWNVPLMRNTEVVERPADQTTITKRYTEEAVSFIHKNQDEPFFLYLAHNLPHVPLFRSEAFSQRSARGLYGDVIEEIDWSVGQVVQALKDTGNDKNTLVVFTSDNGPWLVYNTHGGSAGLLREGKGSCWEGGMREPTIFWMPGVVDPKVVTDLGSTLDLFPTILSMAGGQTPSDRVYDGFDLSRTLAGKSRSPRISMIYYWGEEIWAARLGSFKAHYTTKTEYVGQKAEKHDPPLLFNLNEDPSEKYDIAKDHSVVLERIAEMVEKHRSGVVKAPTQLMSRIQK